MSDSKQYAERDIEQLDEDGEHYFRHMMAMTAEGLHNKSDIAAELGYRDSRIAALLELVLAQHEALDAMRKDLLMRSDESDSDGTKIVNCGRGVWCGLNDALAKYNKLVGER